ncbi:elongation factor G [Pandoraea terrae]|uniref:Elongation factor G n=1 Tax=Pandoraea terrae TaxID=1537710 RepID=A0A5E4SZ80_9BURK|nr:elongation factor G [Pandoraea terrae]VVD80967.1 elongation factor G [Pandoraea terrae]
MAEPLAPTAAIRNIGVIAHIDAGKTTITDRILFHTGRTHRLGSVDNGTTVTDWMAQERERGITIVAAAISARWRDCMINLIDTPGHIDFTAEVQRSLRVLDGAVVLFDAVHGVQPQSETVWRQADRYRVPRLCFINKMDRIGADFERAVASVRERLGAPVACLQVPLGQEAGFDGVIDLLSMQALRWGLVPDGRPERGAVPAEYRAEADAARQRLIEAVAEADDDLLSLYLAGGDIGAQSLREALRRATLANRLFPVCCGAALRDVGVQPLLDCVVDFLPSPLDVGEIQGIDPASGLTICLEPDDEEPLAALVFKIVNDPYVGHLAYARVYSGTVGSGMLLHNATRNRKERAGRLLRMYANHRESVEMLHAGDIGAFLGLNQTFTGDTLCQAEHPVTLESITFPEPVLRATVEPKTLADHDRMADALRQLTDEDPTLQLSVDDESGQLVIAAMGELHLEILMDRLAREYGIAAKMGRPHVAYKETLTRAVAHEEGRFIHQTGGHGQYGHVILSLRPGARGSGVRFENAVSGGAVPRQFIPAVEQGVRDATDAGALAGYPVTDIEVRLEGGSSHSVDSSEFAYRTAAAHACQAAFGKGRMVLLEPMFRIEVLVPTEFTGAALRQLGARRAEIESVAPRPGGVEAIVGQVPLAEMFGYVTDLRSATQGRGLHSMEFDHYAEVEPEVAGVLSRK